MHQKILKLFMQPDWSKSKPHKLFQHFWVYISISKNIYTQLAMVQGLNQNPKFNSLLILKKLWGEPSCQIVSALKGVLDRWQDLEFYIPKKDKGLIYPQFHNQTNDANEMLM